MPKLTMDGRKRRFDEHMAGRTPGMFASRPVRPKVPRGSRSSQIRMSRPCRSKRSGRPGT